VGGAKGPKYIVQFRRKREGRTDYRLRYKLLKSNKPLFIVRSSLKYIYVSIAIPEIGGDRTIITVSSKLLWKKYGWYSLKNIPSAYLTGFLAGKLSLKRGIKEAVLNIGYAWSKKASKPFAAVMGAKDAGMDIPLGEKAIIDEDRIKGNHIAKYAEILKERNPKLYEKRFSIYLKKGIDPINLPKLFEEVKNKIIKEYGGE